MKKSGGLSKETYLKLMEQKGQEPDPLKMPLAYEDLNYDCQIALNIYNCLGNRLESNIGFVGKDYSNLPLLIEINEIVDKEYLLHMLLTIEVFYIEENAKEMKKITDKYSKK